MTSYRLLLPIAFLSVFAFLLLALDAAAEGLSSRIRKTGFWLAIIGIFCGGLTLVSPGDFSGFFGRGMLVWDGLAFFFSCVVLLTILFVVLLSIRYQDFENVRLSTYFALLLLSGIGLILVVSANDFLMIFLSIELVGIPSFILAGYLRGRAKSSEGAIKFFLIGAFSSAMLAYGISLIYGITGTTSLATLAGRVGELKAMLPLSILAMLFVLVSFGFKMALVPFHMWVPDAFEGSPVPIAAFLSVAPKVAGAAITLRVFGLIFPHADPTILTVLAFVAVLTMTIANIIGLQQTNVVRLLAYSSIAHMGYTLMGIISGGPLGTVSVYLYTWVYLFMNIGAFAVVVHISNAVGSQDLDAYAGLARREPYLAGLLALFLVSLAGIPPTAGFLAKFYVLSAAYQSGWIWLVIIGAVNTVIAVGYYFKILYVVYFKPSTTPAVLELGLSERLTLAGTAVITVVIGIAPQFFLNAAHALISGPK